MHEGTIPSAIRLTGFIAQNAETISLGLGTISLFLLVTSVVLILRNYGVFDPTIRRRTHQRRYLVKKR
jgi:hypothetical protein